MTQTSFSATFSAIGAKFTQVEQERDLAGMHERYDAETTGWEVKLK